MQSHENDALKCIKNVTSCDADFMFISKQKPKNSPKIQFDFKIKNTEC